MGKKIFIKNVGNVVHTENRVGLGFIAVDPGKAIELPTKALAEGIIRDSKRGDLKLLVMEEKETGIPKKVFSGGTPQSNK